MSDAGTPPPLNDGAGADPRPCGKSLAEPPARTAAADSSRLGFIALGTGGSLFNLLAAPMLDGSRGGDGLLIAPIVFGVLLGQVGAMTNWLVWGGGSFIRRLVFHWAVGIVLFVCLLAGIVSAMPIAQLYPSAIYEWIAAICLLPILSLAAQVPLWPLRTHLGWRVQARGTEPPGEKPKALSILDILTGTAVVALSLGLMRAEAINSGQYVFWMVLAAWVLVVIVASVILLLPATILVLRTKEAVIGIAGLFGYTLFGTIVFIVASAVFGRGPPGDAAFALLLGCCAFTATMAAPLFVWRACGYRLVWPRDRRS